MNTDYTPIPVTPERLAAARETLRRYRDGKRNLEQRIIENEQWFKLRHWECMRKTGTSSVEPSSAWLFNCIASKHADAMDAFPRANILPREENDRSEAKMLSAIVPVVLGMTDFEEVYSSVWDYKLKAGTGVYGIFWDPEKHRGLGDITVKKVDILNLFWESGVTDIQNSRNLFHVELQSNDSLLEQWPDLMGKLGDTGELAKYTYDDTVDVSDKTAVIDWYYKRHGILHYCKFVGDTVLFATENQPEYAQRGWYDHGLYPFVFDPCFSVEGTPCGFGYIDVGKSAQEYIDRGNQAIMMNLLSNARPRHFIRTDGAVNETEYADLSRDFVHVDGGLGQDAIQPIQGKSLSGVYVQVIQDKIDELKETTGNRDVSSGGATGGVTAASAIAAMQEAGSKLSRDHAKAGYRAFRRVCLMVIELIRQFYDVPRCFRILGEGGEDFVSYSNSGLLPRSQGAMGQVDLGLRLPEFDVEVTAEKQSPYARLSQNELALQLWNAGLFDPLRADQALSCLDMMDFDRKDFLMDRISRGRGLPMPGITTPMPNPGPNINARRNLAENILPR